VTPARLRAMATRPTARRVPPDGLFMSQDGDPPRAPLAKDPAVTAVAADVHFPNPVYAWYVVAVLTLAYIFSFVDRQIVNLLVEPIRHDLGLSDTQISLLQGLAFALFYTVMGLPITRLAACVYRRWPSRDIAGTAGYQSARTTAQGAVEGTSRRQVEQYSAKTGRCVSWQPSTHLHWQSVGSIPFYHAVVCDSSLDPSIFHS